MSYTNRIKTLEEAYRILEAQIKNIEDSENKDKDKLSSLYESKNRCLMQLRELRRLDYEESQRVEFDDR